MGELTAIAWCDSTFNPWHGCSHRSPGCDHCYAEALDHRLGRDHWGPGKPRMTFGSEHWAEPLRWHRKAQKAGVRHRVFCGSMCDWADEEAPPGELERLWELIRRTEWIDWLMLTKRPERIEGLLPHDWSDGYRNVWMGATAENQHRANFVWPILREVPAFLRFLSCEPLLTAIDLRQATGKLHTELFAFPDWVIVGGESGDGARPMLVEWARNLMGQCQDFAIPVFMKQLGASYVDAPNGIGGAAVKVDQTIQIRRLQDRKGGDMSEWPEDLRIRQHPRDAVERLL